MGLVYVFVYTIPYHSISLVGLVPPGTEKGIGKCMEEMKMSQGTKAPDMIKEINGVTYVVKVHFKEGSGETMEQKIKRMLRSEVASMNFAV